MAHTINLPCIKDTWVDQANPDTSHGTDTTLIGGLVGSDKKFAVILLYFDWSLMPARKRITGLKLKFYNVHDLINPETCHFAIKALDILWGEDVTWNTINQQSIRGGTIYLENTNVPGNQYYEISLSTSAYTINGISNYGVHVAWYTAVGHIAQTGYVTMQSREGVNPPILVVTYEDVPPNAPIPLDPIGDYKDNKSVIRFSWQYSSDVGGIQSAFDLQWSTDQANWTTVSLTTANNYYDMPADTLPAGNIYWRVRTYNEYDEVGPYSDIQSFYAIGAPAAPVLNAVPTNSARPIISWSAFSQQAYQLQVLSGDTIVYDSGVVPGISIRQHKIKAWLADGEYTVRLRIKNEYDLWSDWGSTTVTISTDKPEKPSVALQRSAYGVEITGTGLVYRSDYDKDEYICIGMADGSYFDNTVRSKVEYKYFVRAISENDTYNDSDIKFIQAEFQHALIAPVSDLTNVFAFTRSLNAPPKRTYNRQPGGAFVEYAGRKHPVWEPTEHVNAAWAMTFFLKSWNDVEAFIALVDRKETVLYRDARGRKVYGILSNLTINDERSGYIVSFTLTEVDYIEGVDV